MTLTARKAATDEVEGVHVFGLAECEDGSGWTLVLQEGDQRDPHCLSDHLGRSAYDAIKSWSLSGTRLRLSVSSSAQRDLDLPPELVVDLRVPESELKTVGTEMRKVIG